MQTITVKFKLGVELDDGAVVPLHVKKEGEWRYVADGFYSKDTESAIFSFDIDSEYGQMVLASIMSVMYR